MLTSTTFYTAIEWLDYDVDSGARMGASELKTIHNNFMNCKTKSINLTKNVLEKYNLTELFKSIDFNLIHKTGGGIEFILKNENDKLKIDSNIQHELKVALIDGLEIFYDKYLYGNGSQDDGFIYDIDPSPVFIKNL